MKSYFYIIYSFLLCLGAFGVWIAVVISEISEMLVVSYAWCGLLFFFLMQDFIFALFITLFSVQGGRVIKYGQFLIF